MKPDLMLQVMSQVFVLKSGNAVILRGSSYCLDSNIAILEVLQNALALNNCNKNIFQIIESKDRQDTIEFMNLTEFVDLIIPRGREGANTNTSR